MVKYLVRELIKDVYLLRLDDVRTKYFEGLWYIPEGVTYNAYLVTTEEGAVLLDGWRGNYSEEFIEAVKEVTDLKDIKYVIIHHTEPDHSGSLPKLIEATGGASKLLGTAMAKNLLNALLGIDVSGFKVLKDGEVIKLGSKSLKFIYTPWLHWPDTAMTYYVEGKVLFTGDAFGGYSIPPSITDDNPEVVRKYLPYARKYFANIVATYKQHVPKAVSKLNSLGIEVKVIAPLHGLVWVKDPSIIINAYLSWSEGRKYGDVGKKVVITYGSMYGDVAKVCEEVAKELSSAGIEVKVFRFDSMVQDPISEVIGESIDADLIVIGASTYDAGTFPPTEYLVRVMNKKFRGLRKSIAIITSYGWGSVADRELSKLLSEAGLEVAKVIKYRGKPTKEVIEGAKKELINLIK